MASHLLRVLRKKQNKNMENIRMTEDRCTEDLHTVKSVEEESNLSVLRNIFYEDNCFEGKDTPDYTVNLQRNQAMYPLDNDIDKAFQKHFTGDVSSSFYDTTDRHVASDIEVREVSVQTTIDEIFSAGDVCPICNFRRNNLYNLVDLCLPTPAHKQRKLFSDINAGEKIRESVREEGNQNLEFSDDQVVPESASATELHTGDNVTSGESSTRAIRIGLSKRAKIRPLHKTPKSPTTESFIH